MATPAEKVRDFTGLELRRSTRIHRAVRLMIVGQNRQGQAYREKMSTVSLNLHGCCYQSWHNSQLGAKVDLQVTEGFEAKSPVVRARVRSVRPPMSHSELYQIGVEFDTPANIWGITTPPEDWLRVLEGTTTELAPAAAPAPEPEEATAPALPEMQMPAEPEWRRAGVTEFPAPPSAPGEAQPEPAKEAAPAKLERVTITMDQLIAALQGKLQRAADKAVQAALQTQFEETVKSSLQIAVTTQLDEAVRQALFKIDEVSSANVRQAEAFSAQRLEELTRSSKEEIFSRVEARIEEQLPGDRMIMQPDRHLRPGLAGEDVRLAVGRDERDSSSGNHRAALIGNLPAQRNARLRVDCGGRDQYCEECQRSRISHFELAKARYKKPKSAKQSDMSRAPLVVVTVC